MLGKIKEFERREQGYREKIEGLRGQAIDQRKFEQLELEVQQAKVAIKNLPERPFKEVGFREAPFKEDGRAGTSRLDPADKDTTHSRMRRNKIF